jgi:hypothetical protein
MSHVSAPPGVDGVFIPTSQDDRQSDPPNNVGRMHPQPCLQIRGMVLAPVNCAPLGMPQMSRSIAASPVVISKPVNPGSAAWEHLCLELRCQIPKAAGVMNAALEAQQKISRLLNEQGWRRRASWPASRMQTVTRVKSPQLRAIGRHGLMRQTPLGCMQPSSAAV